ncbi:hypothetical protein [Mangrovivirga cuniculi]|uniref:Uncharacterized protein n=1 Tax=Mangrovivirga cuniculi TaxID=2715131 RepID=A0A4D7JLY4_9BACT|nr:hypothetical protein [Mangrovivirga cuniculi]QCK15657.1 hypothetical protein DCC35_13345 [Mangrovivirga cuniculi]
MNKFNFFLLVPFIGILFSCDNNDKIIPPNNNCDKELIMSKDLYENAPSDPLTIESTELNGNCLTINFYAGGCDGSTWKYELIGDPRSILEGPVHHNIRLSLEDNELCEAIIRKEVSFDLNPALSSENLVILTLTNNDEEIVYDLNK